MTTAMLIVAALILGGSVLFVSEKLPVEIVALLIMTVLLASGIVTIDEGLSGFSSPATITVGAMFVLSTGLYKSGALNVFADAFERLARRRVWLSTAAMMVSIMLVSAFINNTAALAIFLPIALRNAATTKTSPSRLLMPLSFASIFGGSCTLIGSSTNLLVAAIAEDHGLRAFGMFEFSRLGLFLALVGLAYMLLIGIRLIPERRQASELTETFGLGDYLVEVVLRPDSRSVGGKIEDSSLVRDLGLVVLDIFREGRRIAVPTAETILRANDVLRLRCDVGQIQTLRERRVILRPQTKLRDADLESEDSELVEAIIAPNSMLVGRSIRDISFRNLFGATVLALRHRGRLLRDNLADVSLSGGDALLLEVKLGHLSQLKGRRDFVLVSEIGLPQFRRDRILPAIAIVVGVVAVASLGWVPITVSAVGGCVLMAMVNCLTLEETYRAIEWKVIFLLAGMLPLGIAIEKTGLAAVLSVSLIGALEHWGGAIAVLSGLYLLTSVLTEIMSNNATAVLLAPVALGIAAHLGVDPRPFLMAVVFAASASFMTPIGYQTNTMIYGAGGYRFRDFIRVGVPLNLLFWIVATIAIPRIWPF